jgi:hypothetical protein
MLKGENLGPFPSRNMWYYILDSKRNEYVSASIVSIPGKGITMHRLNIYLVYVRIPGKGITMHRRLRGDDDTYEIGIGNELGINNCGWSYKILKGSWK